MTWFTGILALVGVLQLVVMFLTWRVYSRQAGIMEKQRAMMEGQWATMQGQLAQMDRAGQQTEQLIKQAVIQATTATLTANAAVNSIRARIAIRLSPSFGGKADDGTLIDQYELFAVNEGESTAEITSTFCERIAVSQGDQVPGEPIYDVAKIKQRRDWVMKKDELRFGYCSLKKGEWDNLSKCGGIAICYGVVCYLDASGQERFTRFAFRYADVPQRSKIGLERFGPETYHYKT